MKYKYNVFVYLLLLAPAASIAQTTLGATNITFYGKIDLAFDTTRFSSTSTLPGHMTHYISNDISYWGVRGDEDLGGNTHLYFDLQSGFSADTGSSDRSGLFSRGSFIGYRASWGAIQIGNQFTPAAYLEYYSDPFTRHAAGNGVTLMQASPASPSPVVGRGTFGATATPNSILYISPMIHGVTGKAFYSFSETTTGSTKVGRYAAESLEFVDGPLYLGVAYEDWVVAATTLAPSADGQLTQRTLSLAVTYDFSVVKFFAYGMKNTLTGQPHVNGYMIGFNVPINKLRINTIYSSRETNNSVGGRSTFYAVGLDYNLSKRTTLYSAIAHMNNETSNNPGAPNNYGLWPSLKTYAPAGMPANGQDLSTLEFGIRHIF